MEKTDKLMITVDIITFTIKDGDLKVLLVKRKFEPFKNKWAIPGGSLKPTNLLRMQPKENLKKKQELEIFT